MQWEIHVEPLAEGTGYVALLSWANSGEMIATAETGEPVDCVAAVAAALTSGAGRAQVAGGLKRSVERLAEPPTEDNAE